MVKFSVVITVYNKRDYIVETLKSVLAQTYSPFEIIILNDGSTDDSETEILKFDDDRIHYFTQENRGAGAARNAAIKKARHPYIALLDADDYWYPHYLETQKRAIEKFPEASVFATGMQKEMNGRRFNNIYSADMSESEIEKFDYFEASLLDTVLTSSNMVLFHRVFEKSGWYDPSIKSGQDTDFHIRLGLIYKVVFSKRISAVQINREDSLSNRTKTLAEKMDFSAYESFEKNNSPLKRFLDLNRYSLCILAKLSDDRAGFEKLYRKINLRHLSKKQRFLLRQPPRILRVLAKTKKGMEKLGIRWGTFK